MKRSDQKRIAANWMKLASEETDPEMKEAMEDLAADYYGGRVKETPRRKQDCKTFEAACRYVFKTAHLHPDDGMVVENGVVEYMDWFGHDFSDKQVLLFKEFVDRGLSAAGFKELRLISTRITAEGAELLRRLLPESRITVILDGDKYRELDLPRFRKPPAA